MYVVATAGHVDHGKSTLVRALTGMEPDRLAEEQRRGLTIDLGFAWTDLPSGRRVAFVDVPGHERFVSTTLAGIGPVPAAIVVVAADEGWRQQTDEHVSALRALRVQQILLVVTRIDLAAPGSALTAAAKRLGEWGIAPAVSVAVSAVTNAGLDDLRAGLDLLLSEIPDPDPGQPVRLWVDRAFTIKGAGTIVTGTLQSGVIATGDQLEVAPLGATVTVRGLQSCQEQVDQVAATARVAANLRRVSPEQVRRGVCLATPGSWLPVETLDVRLDGPYAGTTSVLHVGSAALPVRVRRLDADNPLHVRLMLSNPAPIRFDDRLALRDLDRRRIVGARQLDLNPTVLRNRGSGRARARQLRSVNSVGPDDLVEWHGFLSGDQMRAMGMTAMPQRSVHAGRWWVAAEQWAQWCNQLKAELATTGPVPGRTRPEIAAALALPDAAVVAPLLNHLGADERGGRVMPPAGAVQLDEIITRSLEMIESRLEKAPFDALTSDELKALGLDAVRLGRAVAARRLARIAADVYLLPGAVDHAVELLRQTAKPFSVSEARTRLGSTRRVVLPLLQHLDQLGLTRRIDDVNRVVQ